MTAPQPARVTPAEISALLDHARRLHGGASLAEQITYHTRKTALLDRVAADLGTAEAAQAAAEARACLDGLRQQAAPSLTGTEDGPVKRAQPVLRRADRPGHQPRPVRHPRLAIPGLPDLAAGDRVRAGRPAGREAVRLVRHHPVLVAATALVWWLWRAFGWPGPLFLASVLVTTAGVWWSLWPASFSRLVLRPAYGRWRRGRYQRRWAAVMTIGRLAPAYQGRLLLPVLGKVASTRYTDRVAIRLVSGQSAEDYARRADNLAHGFGAVTCRVRSAKPGRLVLEFVRRDALAQIIPALPIPAVPDLRALPVGKREDGSPWTIRLHGTHLLIAGSTGAGKDSIIWDLVRALLPALRDGPGPGPGR